MFDSIIGSLLGGFHSWKTSLAGIIGFVCLMIHSRYNSVNIDSAQQGTILAFIVLVVGWVAKDSTATGTPMEEQG